LGSRRAQLQDDLRNPSSGKWQGILRDVLKCYRNHRELLVMPELFTCYFQAGHGKKLVVQDVVTQAIDSLITLRNQFHHPGVPEALLPEKIAVSSDWLAQLLDSVQFLQHYPLTFVQRIELRHRDNAPPHYRHDLVQMNGCFSSFDRQRWESEVHLREGRMVLLASDSTGQNLFLDPFLTHADQIPVPGVFDLFLLNGAEQRQVRYLLQCPQLCREIRCLQLRRYADGHHLLG
jgi:hypothetical protein